MSADLAYDCDRGALAPALAACFAPLAPDAAARAFVAGARSSPHGRLATFAFDLLRRLLSDYDAYGLLGMYPMHLLSTAQFAELLREPLAAGRPRRLLDAGAGEGAVTAQAAALFDAVTVTEASRVLRRKLRARGFEVRGVDLGRTPLPAAHRFEAVLCLNVLDRCAYPRTLLAHLRQALAPEGRLLLSVPLPLRPHVQVGGRTADPEEPLPAAQPSWEAGASSLAEQVLGPAGLAIERLCRAPYLSHGDARAPLYVLDAAVFVCRAR